LYVPDSYGSPEIKTDSAPKPKPIAGQVLTFEKKWDSETLGDLPIEEQNAINRQGLAYWRERCTSTQNSLHRKDDEVERLRAREKVILPVLRSFVEGYIDPLSRR